MSPWVTVTLACSTKHAAPANSLTGPCGSAFDLDGTLMCDEDKAAQSKQHSRSDIAGREGKRVGKCEMIPNGPPKDGINLPSDGV